jgi:hypothetical protein
MAHCVVCRWLPSHFVLTWRESRSKPSVVSSIRALIPSWELHSQDLITSLMPHLLSSALWLGFSLEFWKDTNIQTTAKILRGKSNSLDHSALKIITYLDQDCRNSRGEMNTGQISKLKPVYKPRILWLMGSRSVPRRPHDTVIIICYKSSSFKYSLWRPLTIYEDLESIGKREMPSPFGDF